MRAGCVRGALLALFLLLGAGALSLGWAEALNEEGVGGLDWPSLSSYFVGLLIISLSSFPVLLWTGKGAPEDLPGPAKAEEPKEPPEKAETPVPKAEKPAPAPKPKPKPKPKPLSPRSQAKQLVGSRMSEEQATKAAEKILALRRHVLRTDPISLEEMWGFFDLSAPRSRCLDASEPIMQQLKGKLNRQRLLFHPDKNGHPEAEKTFKFLEVCHRKLMTSYTRQTESVHQRTRREEEELKKEEERRKKQEEERRQQMELLEREEEEKMRRQEIHRQRLAQMLEAKQSAYEAKHNQSQMVSRSLSSELQRGLFGSCSTGKSLKAVKEDAEDFSPMGRLSVRLYLARDLPAEQFFGGHHYAVLGVGDATQQSTRVPGPTPKWDADFQFQVLRVDTSLTVSIFREGWFQDSLLGKAEIPFLDIEEWSGHRIGRLLESGEEVDLATVELQASFDWF
ncbi:unnamed protein product [Effrenium voratum]|nr:unnamed protein product [Effrenium voratum]